MSLLSTTIRGALWIAVRFGGRQAANAILFFVLVATLAPSELGIAALGSITPILLMPTVSRGIRDVLIQREDLDDVVRDSALAANTGLGLALMLAVAAAAPLMAMIYGDPRLAALTLACSAFPLIAAIRSVQEALLERAFRQKQISVIYLIAAVLGAGGAITVLFQADPVWTITVFILIEAVVSTILIWMISSWRPRWSVSWAEIRRQFAFATPIILGETVNGGTIRFVELLLGLLLSPAAVAYFRLGGNFYRLVLVVMMAPISQMLLPVFSRSTAPPAETLSKVITVSAAIMLPVFLGLAAVLPEMVVALFAEEWAPAGIAGAILTGMIFERLTVEQSYPMLVAQGKGQWTLVITLAGMVATLAFAAVGALFGLYAVAIACVLRAVVTGPLVLWVLRRVVDIPVRPILAGCLPFAAIAVAMFLVLRFGTGPLLEPIGIWGAIVLQVPIGVIFYVAALKLFGRRAFPAQRETIQRVIPGRLKQLI